MSYFRRYPKYKDSGIPWLGEVPDDWEIWKVAHAFGYIGSGTTPPTDESIWYDGGTIPWVTTGELREKIITKTSKYVTPDAVKRFSALHIHPEGSIAIAMYGATIGRLGIFGVSATTNQACCVLSQPKHLASKFTFYWFSGFKNILLEVYASGGGQPNVNQQIVSGLRIPAPIWDDQQSIANYLDRETARIDLLITKKTRFIELLKEKRQALITEAVTKGLDDTAPMKDSGVKWLGKVPAHWATMPMRYVIAGNLQYGATESGEECRDDWPRYIRITDIDQDGGLKDESAKCLHPRIAEPYLLRYLDILLARSGATVGKSFLYRDKEGNSCFAGYLIRARANQERMLPEFLNYYLQSHSYWEYIVGSQSQATIQNVNADKYASLTVTVPPVPEQSQIITKLDKDTCRINSLLHKTQRSMDLLKEHRAALITAAVTGKIDVREAA